MGRSSFGRGGVLTILALQILVLAFVGLAAYKQSGPSASGEAQRHRATAQGTGAPTEVRAGTALEASSGAATTFSGRLELVDGGGQQALGGVAVPNAVRVRVTDQTATPMAGQPVRFSATTGGGQLAGADTAMISLTDADGIAVAPVWTLGKSTVPQTLNATIGAVSVEVPATVVTHLAIDVRYVGPVDPATHQAMTGAVNRLTAMLTDGPRPMTITNVDLDARCGVVGIGRLTEQTSAVIVYVTEATFLGGDLAGGARVCLSRPDGALPAVAFIQVNAAAVSRMKEENWLEDTMLHELFHAMGFGSFWRTRAAMTRTNLVTTNTFGGAQAQQACSQMSAPIAAACAGGVPLSSELAHWNLGVFGNEMMTQSTRAGARPVSAMTLAAMADVGYTVNLHAADRFPQ